MKIYKKLAGQTIVYGLGTVIPRILNYSILTVYYTRLFSVQDFGILTELYAYITFLLIILTYGMETGYFRFAIGDKDNRAYSSIIITLFTTSALFFIIVYFFRYGIAKSLQYSGYEEFITMLAAIVAIDAFSAIPFAKLRKEERSLKFSALKIINVLVTIGCVILFYIILPIVIEHSSLRLFINLRSDVTFVLLSNLIASVIILLLLVPELLEAKLVFRWKLLKSILIYSLPLLVAGLGGTVSESLDRVLLKHLIPDYHKAIYALGIYGANYRIAVLLLIFIQMFRFAIEPFYFNYYGHPDEKKIFSQIMRLFIATVIVISLMLLLYLQYFKYFIDKKFHEGLHIVPIIVLSYLLYGIFFNLSIWYKLTKKTMYGALLTINGAVLTIIINLVFVRRFSYVAAAYGHLVAYFVTMVLSFWWGRKYYKIDYELKKITEYIVIAIIIFVIGDKLLPKQNLITDILNGLFIIGYAAYIAHREDLFKIKDFLMKVNIVNKSKHLLPKYETDFSAGMDLKANLSSSIVLKPLERILVPTGLFIELPRGYEAQIRPRSGLALKKGITVLNTPGTIDADYRGEIGIILVNLSNEEYIILDGERICQMIISKHEIISWDEVMELNITDRGSGGFGHTGK